MTKYQQFDTSFYMSSSVLQLPFYVSKFDGLSVEQEIGNLRKDQHLRALRRHLGAVPTPRTLSYPPDQLCKMVMP